VEGKGGLFRGLRLKKSALAHLRGGKREGKSLRRKKKGKKNSAYSGGKEAPSIFHVDKRKKGVQREEIEVLFPSSRFLGAGGGGKGVHGKRGKRLSTFS